jgi:hypothetical protein
MSYHEKKDDNPILYVTSILISLIIAGLASLVCPGVLCMDWISGGSIKSINPGTLVVRFVVYFLVKRAYHLI